MSKIEGIVNSIFYLYSETCVSSEYVNLAYQPVFCSLYKTELQSDITRVPEMVMKTKCLIDDLDPCEVANPEACSKMMLWIIDINPSVNYFGLIKALLYYYINSNTCYDCSENILMVLNNIIDAPATNHIEIGRYYIYNGPIVSLMDEVMDIILVECDFSSIHYLLKAYFLLARLLVVMQPLSCLDNERLQTIYTVYHQKLMDLSWAGSLIKSLYTIDIGADILNDLYANVFKCRYITLKIINVLTIHEYTTVISSPCHAKLIESLPRSTYVTGPDARWYRPDDETHALLAHQQMSFMVFNLFKRENASTSTSYRTQHGVCKDAFVTNMTTLIQGIPTNVDVEPVLVCMLYDINAFITRNMRDVVIPGDAIIKDIMSSETMLRMADVLIERVVNTTDPQDLCVIIRSCIKNLYDISATKYVLMCIMRLLMKTVSSVTVETQNQDGVCAIMLLINFCLSLLSKAQYVDDEVMKEYTTFVINCILTGNTQVVLSAVTMMDNAIACERGILALLGRVYYTDTFNRIDLTVYDQSVLARIKDHVTYIRQKL